MNTKQIAEEAWKCIKNLPEDLQFYDEEGQAIIQNYIEKATEDLQRLLNVERKDRDDLATRLNALQESAAHEARASEQRCPGPRQHGHPLVYESHCDHGETKAHIIKSAHASEDDAEQLARTFHETYERLAPAFNYDTRKESAKPWEQVPDTNRKLMIAVCRELLSEPWRCKTKGGAAHASHYEIEAAKKLCELYFNIAAEVIGEDEVRKRRDAMIESRAARASESISEKAKRKGWTKPVNSIGQTILPDKPAHASEV